MRALEKRQDLTLAAGIGTGSGEKKVAFLSIRPRRYQIVL
jgi:hypothetical protein